MARSRSGEETSGPQAEQGQRYGTECPKDVLSCCSEMVAERLVKREAESEVEPLSCKALREHAVHPQGKGTGLEVAGWWGDASLSSDQELLPWRVS